MSIVDLSELEIQLVYSIYADIYRGLNFKIRVAGKQTTHIFTFPQCATTCSLYMPRQFTSKFSTTPSTTTGYSKNSYRSQPILLVQRGPFFDSRASIRIHRWNQLYKVPVTYGRIGTDYVQILSGLQAGDIIISSTVTEFADAETIYLQL